MASKFLMLIFMLSLVGLGVWKSEEITKFKRSKLSRFRLVEFKDRGHKGKIRKKKIRRKKKSMNKKASLHRGVARRQKRQNRKPSVSFWLKSGEAFEDQQTFLVKLLISHPPKEELTLHYRITDGSAQEGVDYEVGHGILVIPPGAQEAHLPIRLKDDGLPEEDETVEIELVAAQNGLIGRNKHYTFLIMNPPTP